MAVNLNLNTMPMLKLAYRFIVVLLLFLASAYAFACKVLPLPNEYPIQELSYRDELVVVYINRVANVHSEMYAYTDKFEGKIVKSYRGTLNVGENIVASHMLEEAQAACPVHLLEGEAYLMVLKPISGQLKYSRFNLYVNSKSKLFTTYVNALQANTRGN
ncbi:hypothetical protein [Teredinibacter sp. KSP-S5-2]|uniref:hypothetical protein n=1 Tax=Teredinibacter sp. KSP-S5-2 TaxID=3034506 RepID=UPI002935300F|nr:hypothetical protein [Teredinibacter sp. KSP-S5-2]WNO07813.1 hypothetical protein P5V12_12515 [Teredinibacter sp. KSP-S5-2]